MPLLSDKKLSIILHIVAWVILSLLPIYLITTDRGMDVLFMQRVFMRTFVYILIFYLNYFIFIPRLLFVGKKLKYYIALVAVVIALYFATETINRYVFVDQQMEFKRAIEKFSKDTKPFKNPWKFDIYNYLFTTVLISGFSIGLRMNGRFQENEKKRKELEKEKLSSELAFLKNQVSPHFFFNTLNNIFALTETNTKDAQKAILQLSTLMRYLLYDSEKGDTKLSNEIEFMQNYIQLMRLRLSDKVSLSATFPEQYTDIDFPPLLFISFIENAFKHGISYREPSFIDIHMQAETNNIRFVCKNSLAATTEISTEPGIGLENIKKRLALLYPNKHSLKMGREAKTYVVALEISL